MIKAIIFDCFGVLTTDGWLPFKDKYFSHDPEQLQQATDLNKQVDAGLIDYHDFVTGIAQMAGVAYGDAHKAIEGNVANDTLFDYIAAELKPEYKIGLLSNAGANWLDRLFTPVQIGLLDAVVLSYEVGYLKPDARAYQAVMDKLGVIPQECIFIDDQVRYVSAAEDVGMQAIVYTDLEQLRRDLRPRLEA